MSDFAGRVALVTGAASGIGAAVADALRTRGARGLLLVDRDAIAGTEDDICLSGDVADEALWDEAEKAARTRWGGLDIAIVNAGVSDAAPIAHMPLATWRRVLSTNLDGAFLTMRCAMRLMERGGAIVAVSSASAFKTEPGVGAYGASKAALLQLVRVAAKEGAAAGVRVNAIAPGGVETPMWSTMPFFQDMVREHGGERAAFDALAAHGTPLGRYATPVEIAAQILFLCGADAASITGAVLTVDGGYTL